MEAINVVFITSLWSSKEVGWEFVESVGSSEGILSMWDSSSITVLVVIKGRFSISIKCLSSCKQKFWVTNVYEPCGYTETKFIWPELSSLSQCLAEA